MAADHPPPSRRRFSGGPNFAFELCLRRIADDEIGRPRSLVAGATSSTAPSRSRRDTMRRFAAASALGPAAPAWAPATASPNARSGWLPAAGRARLASTRSIATRSRARGEAVPAPADAPSPLRDRRLRPGLRRQHDVRVVDAAGLELGRPPRRPAAVPRPVGDHGLLPQRRGDHARAVRPRLGQYRRPRLSLGRHALHHRPRKDIIIRGGRNISPYELEQAIGDLAGIRRGCVAVFALPDPRPAPSASPSSPSCAIAKRRGPRRPEALDQRARRPHRRRARRRDRSRPARHGAQDVERQDPARSGARAARARPGVDVAPAGVGPGRPPVDGRGDAAAAPCRPRAGGGAVRVACRARRRGAGAARSRRRAARAGTPLPRGRTNARPQRIPVERLPVSRAGSNSCRRAAASCRRQPHELPRRDRAALDPRHRGFVFVAKRSSARGFSCAGSRRPSARLRRPPRRREAASSTPTRWSTVARPRRAPGRLPRRHARAACRPDAVSQRRLRRRGARRRAGRAGRAARRPLGAARRHVAGRAAARSGSPSTRRSRRVAPNGPTPSNCATRSAP